MSGPGAAAHRIQEIDLLRFLAALAVMLFHYSSNNVDMAWMHPAARYGYLGVELFFLISGYVITLSVAGKSARQFIASRLTRLYPSFWICLTLTILLVGATGKVISPVQALANATMLPALFRQPMVDTVYWTLLIEIKFYVLILVLMLARQMPRLDLWMGVWLLVSAAQVLLGLRWLDSLVLGGYAPLFIAGCIFQQGATRGFTPLRCALLGVAFLLGGAQVAGVQVTFTNDRAAAMPGVLLYAVVYAVFLGVALGRICIPPSRAWLWLGAMTYPLYLIHGKAGMAVRALAPDAWPEPVKSVVMLVFSLGVAMLLAVLVERRLCPWLGRRVAGMLGAR